MILSANAALHKTPSSTLDIDTSYGSYGSNSFKGNNHNQNSIASASASASATHRIISAETIRLQKLQEKIDRIVEVADVNKDGVIRYET
jgi:hypothetical protein